jgi:hypothetical protein
MKMIINLCQITLLLLLVTVNSTAQISPNQSICPGTTVTYSVGAPFTGLSLK